jgi:hypothetical protein
MIRRSNVNYHRNHRYQSFRCLSSMIFHFKHQSMTTIKQFPVSRPIESLRRLDNPVCSSVRSKSSLVHLVLDMNLFVSLDVASAHKKPPRKSTFIVNISSVASDTRYQCVKLKSLQDPCINL